MSSSPTAADEAALASAATQVYAVTPEEFMAVRTDLVRSAKASGDKELAAEIGRLRKPSVSAWSLNLLAHQGSPLIAELAELGRRMRSATSRLDVGELTAVRPERDRVLAAFVDAAAAAVEDAGRTLSGVARDEVRDSAIAALADADAQAAVESGTLVRALSYSGFGEVDVADAVAVTSTGRVLGVIRGGGGRDEDATGDPEVAPTGDDGAADPEPEAADRRADAQAALAAAEAAVADANAAVAEADELLDSARERRAAAQRQLDRAESAVTAAADRLSAAKRARRAAEEARHAAEDELEAFDA